MQEEMDEMPEQGKENGALIMEDFFAKSIIVDTKRIFPMLVMATMSSGKSTLINALLGQELLPAQNTACTAKIYSILDDDQNSVPRLYITNTSGRTVVKEENLAEELRKANNDESVADIFICGQINGVLNTDKALLIIDTPGPNNSADESHERITDRILNKVKGGLILYVLNATQLAILDDRKLLEKLCCYLKKHERLKILFVLNKVDQIDEERESLEEFVISAKEYLTKIGFPNPSIIPVSALAAEIFKKVLNGEKLTRQEYVSFGQFYEKYKPKDYNMKAYAITEDHPELSGKIEVRDKYFKIRNISQALENTGIKFLEENIQKAQILSSQGNWNSVQVKIEENAIFEIGIMGGMHNGKTTLVNSLLHTELLPVTLNKRVRVLSKNGFANYKAIGYGKDGKTLVFPRSVINRAKLKKYRSDQNVEYIDIEGNIPLVSGGIPRLCLYDISYSSYGDHEYIQGILWRMMKEENSIIFYVMDSVERTREEEELLGTILKALECAGKQANDKLVFLLNKCDFLDKEREWTVAKILEKTIRYLGMLGIDNPILIPVSGKIALIIQKSRKGDLLSRTEEYLLKEWYAEISAGLIYYEKYAALPNRMREKINKMLSEYHKNQNKEMEALIHTGVFTVEEIIKERVGKM